MVKVCLHESSQEKKVSNCLEHQISLPRSKFDTEQQKQLHLHALLNEKIKREHNYRRSKSSIRY